MSICLNDDKYLMMKMQRLLNRAEKERSEMMKKIDCSAFEMFGMMMNILNIL